MQSFVLRRSQPRARFGIFPIATGCVTRRAAVGSFSRHASVVLAAWVFALCVLGGCGGSADPASDDASDASGPRRSILLVTLDTTRADAMGCYGGRAHTPVFDAIASRGARFERALTTAPITLPAHATLLTGTYPPYHGARHNGAFAVPGDVTTLAEYLTPFGYEARAVIGAAVLDAVFGLDQGFDAYDDLSDDPLDVTVGSHDVAERRATDVTDRALAQLSSSPPEQPIFLWAHYFDAHAPYEPPEPFASEYADAPYFGEVAAVDAELARLLEAFRLRESVRTELAPLIVVVADHGEGLGDHGEATHGMTLYEEAVRVPFAIELDGIVRAGLVVDRLVETVDLVPTVMALLELRPDETSHWQGRSLDRLLRGLDDVDDGEAREAYLETYYPQFGYGWESVTALSNSRHKYIDAPRVELFDLQEDPREKRNQLVGSRGVTDLERPLRDALEKKRAAIRSDHPFARLPAGMAARTGHRLEQLGYVRATTTPGPSPVTAAPRTAAAAAAAARVASRGRAPRFWLRPPRNPADLVDVWTTVQAIEARIDEADFAGALEELQQVDEERRSRPPFPHLESTIRSGLDQPEASIAIDRAILGRNGRDAIAAVRLAETLTATGGDSGRIADHIDTARRFASTWPVHVALARLALASGDLDAAHRELDTAEALADRPGPAIWTLRAEAFRREGRTDEARSLLLRALSRDPEDAEAALQLAELQLRVGRATEALQHLARFLPTTGEPREDAMALAIEALLVRGQTDLAEDQLRNLRELAPQSPELDLLEARIHLARERYPEAAASLRRAARLHAESPRYLEARAELLVTRASAETFDPEEALVLARRAHDRGAGPDARYLEARALRQLDRLDEAVAVCDAMLATALPAPLVKRFEGLLRRIEKLRDERR